jgi:hypothetical protein
MIATATTPIYFDDGLGSSAHVFLRISEDRFALFTHRCLEISCVFSCSSSAVKFFCHIRVQVKSTTMYEWLGVWNRCVIYFARFNFSLFFCVNKPMFRDKIISTWIKVDRYSHSFELHIKCSQLCFSCADPLQSLPPCDGGGESHDLNRVRFMIHRVGSQTDHSPHVDQDPSTTERKPWSDLHFEWVIQWIQQTSYHWYRLQMDFQKPPCLQFWKPSSIRIIRKTRY